MAELLAFTGGRRCDECDEQIPPRRLRAQPDAARCVACEARVESGLVGQAMRIAQDERRNG